MYTALVLLFTVQAIELLRFGTPKPAGAAALFATAVLLCLTRNNGVYLLVPTAVVLVLVLRGKTAPGGRRGAGRGAGRGVCL